MALSGKANEDPVQTHCKREILGAFWPQDTSPVLAVRGSRDRCPWNAYFQHYTVECRKTIEPDGGKHATVRQHQDIISIIRQLEEGHTKETIKLSLAALVTQQRSETDKQHMAEGSIRLAVRLFLMVDVGAPSKYRTWGPSFLPWSDEQTVEAVLTNHFVISSTESQDTMFKEEFTAFNLQRFTGLEIQWTNNLADHLRLIDNDRRLYIFHHATFLQHQTRHVSKYYPTYVTDCSSDLFPDNFINETLRTLDLLFPRQDAESQRWLRAQHSQGEDVIHPDFALLDRNTMFSTDRRAANFMYWRDELISLKERFDQPKPTSISQFWYDRRNRTQWYTFWIAVTVLCLTVFFGLVQSIEGALQVYKAYHPVPN